MSVFRVKWMTAPETKHIYCRVFSAPSPQQTYAGLGNLTLDKTEWEDFKRAFSGAQFIEEDLR